MAIYDWEATTLYDDSPGANLPTVQAFWASEEPAEFSLATAGNVDLIEFARWIEATSIGLENNPIDDTLTAFYVLSFQIFSTWR